MDTTEIIKNTLDWVDKRLDLKGEKLTEYQRDYLTFALQQNLVKNLIIAVVSSSFKPEPPKLPLCRVVRTGVGRFCRKCNSTMSKHGFLRLFGKRYCDNKKCPNSKPEKNYY